LLYLGRKLEEWLNLFRSDEKGRDGAVEAFIAIGRPAVPPLVGLLHKEEAPITRAVAASTLWLMRRVATEAVPALESTLSSDPDVVVRLRAVQALTGISETMHVEATRFLRQTARSADPSLMRWIKEDARRILRDAKVPEE
jgi:HEAT repeat protein